MLKGTFTASIGAGMVIILAGCAPAAQTVWLHSSYTPQLWAQDSYECERQAQAGGMSVGVPIGGMVVGVPMGGYTDQAVMQRCLEARGWRLTYR